MEVNGQLQAPAGLLLGKGHHYPTYTRLGVSRADTELFCLRRELNRASSRPIWTEGTNNVVRKTTKQQNNKTTKQQNYCTQVDKLLYLHRQTHRQRKHTFLNHSSTFHFLVNRISVFIATKSVRVEVFDTHTHTHIHTHTYIYIYIYVCTCGHAV